MILLKNENINYIKEKIFLCVDFLRRKWYNNTVNLLWR